MSGIITPYRYANPNFFGDLVALGLTSNLKLCLDAGAAASYASGQTWADLTANGNDVFRGADGSASSDDPTHNGTPGDLSSGEYWSVDAADFFRLVAGSNPTSVEDMHKNNADFTVAAFVYVQGAATLQGIFGTAADNTGNVGVQFILNSSEQPTLEVVNGSGFSLSKTWASAISTGAWHMLAVSLDEAAGGTGSFFFVDNSTSTFDGTYSSPSASAATYKAEIGAAGNAVKPLANTSRIGGLFVWSESLTTGQMTSVWNATKGRFGL